MSERAAAPARAIALRILIAVDRGHGNSSILLDGARFRSVAERALATELVLGVLRRTRALDALAAKVSSRAPEAMDPAVRAGIRLGIHQLTLLDRIPVYAAVGETVEAVKHELGRREAAFVNGVLRGYERKRRELELPGPDEAERYLTTTLSLPRFLAERWCARFGVEATGRIAEAATRPPAVTLRVVAGRGTPAEAREALARDGVETSPGRYLEETLVVRSGVVTATAAFRGGRVMIQDEAAQLVARLVAPAAGERVLDACAAPGGKSVALADLGAGAVRVVAGDARIGRLRLLAGNVARTGACAVAPVVMDAARPPFAGARFARILIDAPCTGTGTIRRNPELRERVDALALERSGQRADAILAALAPLVQPGGRMVYATCSAEPEENDEPVTRLLEREPELERIDPRPCLPEAACFLVGPDLGLRTWPGEPELDGFTAFVLERRPRG